ncbi:hypothetical protein [Albibacterium profundi]|uniref:Cardiolipin synthase N-terminal domain-containing protein n=1 Tax=Albibacterium profundi TaxID=3134906 RepID=A0ABV5CCP4_9SPHI
MDTPSLIFLAIFVIPFVVLLIWIARKDKRTKTRQWGLLALIALIIAALYVAFFIAPQYETFFPNN